MAAPPQFPRLPSGAPVEALPQGGGFDIVLPSAQLGDLIQINCMNRVRGVFQLSSGRHRGHLFFDAGRLIHADLGGATGLDAVVQMLGLRGGSIRPCSRPWPKQSTIDMGADALLLRAAQRLDEMPSGAENCEQLTTKVVRRAPRPLELVADAALSSGESEADEARLERELAPDAAGHPEIGAVPADERLCQLQVAQVRFDGAIQQLKAGASPELADTAFFCQRMASMIGETLGLGECRALALDGHPDGIVVFKARSIVGARGKAADLDFILAKVGLR